MDYMAHYEKSPRLWSQGLHAHDYYEIFIHLEGGRNYCVDDRIYELNPNQLLIIPPLHMHGLVCDRDLVDYERCYLYLSPEMIQKCDIDKMNLSGILDSSVKKNKTLSDLSESDAELCKKILRNIEQQTNSSSSKESKLQSNFELYINIFRVLQIVCNNLSSGETIAPQKTTENQIVKILHYINEHFTQNISVESISNEFHISESSLSHRFRAYVNKSVYEYILYKRIILAKELMYSNLSLTEIAYKCGFSDYSNFLRVFTKQTGISPKLYRKEQ